MTLMTITFVGPTFTVVRMNFLGGKMFLGWGQNFLGEKKGSFCQANHEHRKLDF